MKVTSLHKNQLVIEHEGVKYFQSYSSVVARIDKKGNITLSADWDFSNTTLRHLYSFLRAHSYLSGSDINKGAIQDLIDKGSISYVSEKSLTI